MAFMAAKSLAGLMRSQWRGLEQQQQIQLLQLQQLIQHASENIPFYKKLYADHGVTAHDLKSLDDFAKLPSINKAMINASGSDALLDPSLDKDNLHCVQTGGSTGKILNVYMSPASRKRRVASIYRTLIAHGYRPQHKLLYGQQYPGGSGFLEKLGLMRSYELHLEENPQQWLQRLVELKPEFLSGHSSIFSEIGQQLQQSGDLYRPKAIICNSEALTPNRAKTIEASFGVTPTDVYDSWEFGTIAWQCPEHQGLHVNNDLLHVEINEQGRLIITDLFNTEMPMIRYDIGDSAQWQSESCACGRKMPMLKNLVGKSIEPVILSDGSESLCAYRLAVSLYLAYPTLLEVQVQQYTPGKLRVMLQLDNWPAEEINTMEGHLAQKFDLEEVSIVNGKDFVTTKANKRPLFYSHLKHSDQAQITKKKHCVA